MPYTTQLWLGDQMSYLAATDAFKKAAEKPGFHADSGYMQAVLDQIMSVQDGVATIRMHGSLVSGSAGFGIFFGVLGYEDLRNALSAAVSNSNVSAILLDVSSGGGAVAGVHETAQLIARINKIKPVVTYSGSVMASAAIWTGASASKVLVSETAIVGSIGIIMTHLDRTKQLADMGVTATVIRAGSEKALNNPYEPLSTAAKDMLQSQANTLYDIFMSHMADVRSMTVPAADKAFGQGREFIGQQAVDAGLVDEVGTFEDAFAAAMKLGTAKKTATKPGMRAGSTTNSRSVQAATDVSVAASVDNQPSTEGTPMTKPLSQELLAAMAAGVALPVVDTVVTDSPESAPEASTTDVKPEANVEEKPATATAVLEGLLAKAQEDLVSAKVTANEATAALEVANTQNKAFVEIARNSVKTMGVHFGVKAETADAMAPAEILAEHGRLAGLFQAKFKVGSVAATTQEEVQKPKATVSPMFTAVMKSSTLAK